MKLKPIKGGFYKKNLKIAGSRFKFLDFDFEIQFFFENRL